MFATLMLIAQENNQPPPGAGWINFLPIVAIVVMAYFFLMRPMRRQEQMRQQMIAQLTKGDKVVTSAGIIGTVVNIADKEDEITVKVDDNVRLKMLKSAIARNVSAEEALKEQKGQPEASKT